MQPKQWIALGREAVSGWASDRAPSMGAAISYYSMFSIAPLLVIVIAVAGMFFGEDAVRGAVFGQLADLMGEGGAKAVEEMLAHAQEPKTGAIATIASVFVLLLGASGVFGELQLSLDRIWEVPAKVKESGLFKFLRARLLSLGMVLVMAFLITVSLVLSAALAALGKWWGPFFKGWELIGHALDIGVSFAMLAVVFAAVYKLMPRANIRWRDVWVGAAVTALLFAIGKFAIGLYLGKSSVASSFGTFGSLVIVMLWMYYSAQIFLLGAEFTWVYAHKFGSRRGKPEVVAEEKAKPQPAPARELRIEPRPVSRRKTYARAAASGGAFALGVLLAKLTSRRGGAG
jgi:membrane protein